MAPKHNSAAVQDSLLTKHPAQRFASPSAGLSCLLHATGLASFAYSFWFLHAHPNKISDSYGWHFQFLTIIGLSFAVATFTAGLLADIFKSSRLFVAKNALSVTGAPMEVLISILYWGLKSIEPTLVRDPTLPTPPFLADFSFHAMPAIVLVLDILFFSPPWTVTAAPALCISSGLAVAYWFWIEHTFSVNGFYPYPIFNVPVEKRAAIFAVSAVVMTASTFGLKAMYALVNGVDYEQLGGVEKLGEAKAKAKAGSHAKKAQ